MNLDDRASDAHFERMHPPDEEPIMKTCPICEREFDEDDMDYPVCDECIRRASSLATALKYGGERKQKVEINSLYAKVLSPEQIDEALKSAVEDMRTHYIGFFLKSLHEFINDDTRDFADWLVDQKTNK